MNTGTKGPRLSRDERKALSNIRNGADIFSPVIARTLRDIEKKRPELLVIHPAIATDYHGARPYFGAILTAAGAAAIEKKGGAS